MRTKKVVLDNSETKEPEQKIADALLQSVVVCLTNGMASKSKGNFIIEDDQSRVKIQFKYEVKEK